MRWARLTPVKNWAKAKKIQVQHWQTGENVRLRSSGRRRGGLRAYPKQFQQSIQSDVVQRHGERLKVVQPIAAASKTKFKTKQSIHSKWDGVRHEGGHEQRLKKQTTSSTQRTSCEICKQKVERGVPVVNTPSRTTQ